MESIIYSKAVKLLNGEYAWRIKDIYECVFLSASKEDRIILGGDILNADFSYTYDSWFYNVCADLDLKQNSDASINRADKYIRNYVRTNGEDFYVVIVFA